MARRSATASSPAGSACRRRARRGRGQRPQPDLVIVPCHRVIGADGSLTGYGGGLERKRLLLDLEAGVLTLGECGLPYGRRDSVPGGSTKRSGVLDSASPL